MSKANSPLNAPRGNGRKPPPPKAHSSSGKGPCEMWVPIAIGATIFYALPRLAIDTWRERRGRK